MSNHEINQPYSLLEVANVQPHNLWFEAANKIVSLKSGAALISTSNIEQEKIGITVSGSDLIFVEPLEIEDIKYQTKVSLYDELQISVDLFTLNTNGIQAYSLIIGIEDMRTFRFIHAFNMDTRIINLSVVDDYLVVEYA